LPDPNLQQELTQASKTATIVHGAMLCEPVILVVVALVLKSAGVLRTMGGEDSLVGMMRMIFFLLSLAAFGGFFAAWRIMLAPEKMVPRGVAASKIRSNYVSAHVCLDVIATLPTTFGFVLFVLSGNMIFLVAVAVVGVALMIFVFPRPENLASMVAAQMAKADEPSIGTLEEWEQYKKEKDAHKEA
jgi:hypothetical protein